MVSIIVQSIGLMGIAGSSLFFRKIKYFTKISFPKKEKSIIDRKFLSGEMLKKKTSRKKKIKNSRYQKNREHIKQVKKRKDREQIERIGQRIREKKRSIITVSCILAVIVFIVSGISIVRAVGKNRLQNQAAMKAPELDMMIDEEPLTEEEENKWQEGWVKYQGKIYQYNEEVMTFLVMGIDKYSDVEEVPEGTDGGQADALFLVILNPKDKTIKVLGINRNSMTDIDIYDDKGEYTTTVKAQIAVQHGFGNGMEESCEYQVKAVENLLYGVPIHGYAAVNMSAIATINDAVGGVEVTVLEDLTKKDASLVEGSRVHLMGESAFWYVKYRDVYIEHSADGRLERQKQYLKAFINTAKQAAKEDISVILDLYKAVIPQMVTNVSLDEVAYLAPVIVDYQFHEDSFYSMKGESVRGENFDEFYFDEPALREMILEIFYEEVELD